MNRNFNKLAAAVAIVFSGAAFAQGMNKETTTQTTTQKADGSVSQTTTVQTERLNALNGVIVRDISGKEVGTVKSYTNANGEVTATVISPAGSSTALPLGAPDVLITEIPASGSFGITVDSSGVVQRPIGVTKKTTTTTTIR